MAPKKRPTAKDLGLTSPKRDGRKLTAKELSTMVKSMAPKARSPYALYLHEQHPIQRSRLQSEGLGGSGLQRAVVAAVSTAWREMPPEEKKIWEKKSAEERSRRQAALDEMQSSVELDKAPCSHQDSADTVIGCYIMEGAKAWVGSASWSVKAHHKRSLSAAQVIHFRDQDAFARELQVLREIEEQRDPSFCEEVYLQCYQATGVNSLPMALVCEDLPRVDQVLTQQGGLALPTFRSAAHQLGLALCQLHQLKIAHGDIKPAALFFSSEQNLLKLSRFSLSVPIPQEEPLDMMRYSAGFRAPELWVPLNDVRVSQGSEAWAFAITLIEMYTGRHPSENIKDVCKVDLSCLHGLPCFLRGLVLPFLRQNPEHRMTVQEFMSKGLALALQPEEADAMPSAHDHPGLQT